MKPWSSQEIATLIRGVFRFGENEWTDLNEDIFDEKARLPNELALKWRQVKQLMNQDIKRVLKET